MKRIGLALFAVALSVVAASAGYRTPSVQPTTCTAHQWINVISAGLVPSCAQPAAADISGLSGAATATYVSAGSWTPTDASAAGLVFTSVSANYTQIGNMVFAYVALVYPTTASASNASIGGLPIAAPNQGYARQCSISYASVTTLAHMSVVQNTSNVALWTSAGVGLTNSAMSGTAIVFECIYPIS